MNDEKLLDAVHRGDRDSWEKLTTPDFMYVEDGEVSRRIDFLHNLAEDGARPLVIETYEVKQAGDTAIVMHLDGLSARDQIDPSRSKFLFLETWQRLDSQWKLRLLHIDRLRVDPPAVALTVKQKQALTGEYRSGADRYSIFLHDDHLVGRRLTQKEETLEAETPDVLFIPGDFFLRKVFRSNERGVVTSFVDRRVAADRIWTRVVTRPDRQGGRPYRP